MARSRRFGKKENRTIILRISEIGTVTPALVLASLADEAQEQRRQAQGAGVVSEEVNGYRDSDGGNVGSRETPQEER